MAYLSQTRSNGQIYIYLQEYSNETNSTKRYRNIYGFGRKEVVLLKLKQWQRDKTKFPRELREKGFSEVDLKEWIKTLETGITKTGRSAKFKIS